MLDLIETALAAWRLASLLVNEDGPFGIFARLRYAAGLRSVVGQGPHGRPVPAKVATSPLAEGLTCVWCVSIWTAAVLAPASLTRPGRLVRRILAASAGAILAHEAVEAVRHVAGK